MKKPFPTCQCGFKPTSTSVDNYNDKYDSYICTKCNVWLETKCEDAKGCPICTGRPEKPSELTPCLPKTTT